MRKLSTASVLTLGLAMWGCSTTNPAAPTPTTSNGIVTIDVVAINGAQSFSPNPATLPAGQRVVWHNVNDVTHRMVLNDRSVIGSTGGQYHCSIHPEMIGSVNQDTPTGPPAPSYQMRGPFAQATSKCAS